MMGTRVVLLGTAAGCDQQRLAKIPLEGEFKPSDPLTGQATAECR